MQENTSENTTEIPVAETKMSGEQIKRMLGDIVYEMRRIEYIKLGAEVRVRHYDDVTNHVKFLKKRSDQIQRDLRRLNDAHRRVEQCIEALNSLSAQAVQYQQQLMAV